MDESAREERRSLRQADVKRGREKEMRREEGEGKRENASGEGGEVEKQFDRSGRNFHRNWQKILKTRRQSRTTSRRTERGGDG